MKNKIALIHRDVFEYPEAASAYRPSIGYPEYMFGKFLSNRGNEVYDMVREGFYRMGLDSARYGTKDWNPLGVYISHGDTVLLKPNFVMHENGSGESIDCLITHPSVIAAVLDYVFIALGGTGKVILGDAPIQDCHWDELLVNGGIDDMLAFYKEQGLSLELQDFRNVKRDVKDGVYADQQQESSAQHGILVQMGDNSAFAGLPKERLSKMRVTNYDPRIMNKHQAPGVHNYNVSEIVLEADVVISLPKPKTHRFGGITAALKNMVGINANKECLPHHTLGSSVEGGDCYQSHSSTLTEAARHLDARNMLTAEGKVQEAVAEWHAYRHLLQKGQMEEGEKYWNGSWYGNDTIWRTIADLNHILYFADKDGKLQEKPQRKVLIVADMIQGGQRSGPLSPIAAPAGVIAVAEHPLLMDKVLASVMGFDYKCIPQLAHDEILADKALMCETAEPQVVSNDASWQGADYGELKKHGLHFQPCHGWEKVLGYGDFDELRQWLKEKGGHCQVIGFGHLGMAQAQTLLRWGMKVDCFLDNNEQKIGKSFQGIPCHRLREADKSTPCLIAVRGYKPVNELRRQGEELGIRYVRVFNDQTEA